MAHAQSGVVAYKSGGQTYYYVSSPTATQYPETKLKTTTTYVTDGQHRKYYIAETEAGACGCCNAACCGACDSPTGGCKFMNCNGCCNRRRKVLRRVGAPDVYIEEAKKSKGCC